MKKPLFVFTMCLLLASCGTLTDTPKSGIGTESGGGKGENKQAPAPAPYFTGSGGKGLSLAVLAPTGNGLSQAQAHLPTLVQGVFVGDFSKYSGISVLDRQNLDKIIAENYSGYYEDDHPDLNKLGHMLPTDFIMTGTITKTGAGYALQIQIADNKTGFSKASYTGNCSIAEFEDFTGIRRASAELLSQMDVSLTDRAKQELSAAGEGGQVSAQTALAKGVTAQRRGTVVEAMSYYYEATAFDPSLLEAAQRSSDILTTISSGNIGENVRNDIQRRAVWVKTLNEATAFFKEHPPFEIVYDTTLRQGDINHDKGTVQILFDVYLIGTTGFNIINDLKAELEKTGKSREWKLDNWPDFNMFVTRYRVLAALVNENGKPIGAAEGTLDADYSIRSIHDHWKFSNTGAREVHEWDSFPHTGGLMIFHNVKAEDITDNLTVSIRSVNGIDAQTAGSMGYIGISAVDFSDSGRFHFNVRWQNGGVVIQSYTGGGVTNLSIPGKIGKWPVIGIDKDVFNQKKVRLTSLSIPEGLTFIGNDAFRGNQLTSLTIPKSVTSIGSGAFFDNQLESVTILNSATVVKASAFRGNPLKSITIPANVSLGSGAFETTLAAANTQDPKVDFNQAYAANGKKAGTYTFGSGGPGGLFVSPGWRFEGRYIW